MVYFVIMNGKGIEPFWILYSMSNCGVYAQVMSFARRDDNFNTLNFDLWNWTLIDDVTCNWLGDEIQGLRLQAVFMQLFTGVVSIL